MTRLYKLTEKGKKLLRQLEYNENKHVKLAEDILFPAIKPKTEGVNKDEISR